MAFISIGICLGAIAVALYYLRAWFGRNALARQHGCQLPPKRQTHDPILGLSYKMRDSDSSKNFKSLPMGASLHREYGPTYRQPTLFGTTIKTSDAENIQAVFGSKAKDFGVQPFRLVGMRPFCGDGLLTRDGQVWD